VGIFSTGDGELRLLWGPEHFSAAKIPGISTLPAVVNSSLAPGWGVPHRWRVVRSTGLMAGSKAEKVSLKAGRVEPTADWALAKVAMVLPKAGSGG